MNKLFTELRRRNIFRIAGVYAVTGWILMQVVSVMTPALNLPDWVDSFFAVVLMIGFPIAMLLAWAFEMTPEGVKRAENVKDGESITDKTGRKLDYTIVGGLVVVGALVVWQTTQTPNSAPVQTQAEISTPNIAVQTQTDEKPSIAVMPFEDFSAAKDQEYFASGISEELLNVLSRIEGLKVSSRTSSFAFKEREASTGEIAEALGVKHILEGSIRKSGTTLRITAQLIDTANDEHMWSQTYDRPLTADNIFAIQDEIAAAIVAELKGRLSIGEVEVTDRTASLEAYELYLRARQQMNKRLPDALRAAEAGYKQVIALDPEFAPAFSGLADTYMLMEGYTDMQEDESNRLAKPNVERALQLAPNSAESLTTAAMFATDERRFDQAVALANRAIAVNSNYADAYLRKARALRFLSRYEESMIAIQKARSLDPLSAVILDNLGYQQLLLGDKKAAIKTMRDNIRWNPDNPSGLIGLASIFYLDGDIVTAHGLNKDAQPLNPEHVQMQNQLVNIYLDVGMYDAALFASKEPYNRSRALLLMGKRQQSLKLVLDNTETVRAGSVLYLHGNLKDSYQFVQKSVRNLRALENQASFSWVTLYADFAFVFQKNGDGNTDVIMGKIEDYLGTETAMDKTLPADLIAGIKLHLLKGDTDAAYIWLDRYLDLGFANIPLLKEPPFDSLRGSPEFEKRVARMAKNAAKYRAEIEAQLA
ncbi:MAG: hypothetical protein JKY46_09280, partial [Robiginitomaculum sp.]|nr:hypothetical protein [Robiginitomaculum sp.]